MKTLDLRRDAAAAEYPALAELSGLEAAARTAWPDLPPPIVLPWSDEAVLALDRGEPWLYGPAERDPMRRDGRMALPRAPRRRLAAQATAGVPFQRIAVAHQLDRAGAVAGLLPALRHGPRLCTDEVARAVAGPVPPLPGLARVLGMAEGILRGRTRDLAATVGALLDPIVFGVLGPRPPRHGDPCLWFALAAWRW